ncbi:MAG: 12-oxophytodienoate reductase, partial [Spongiibacteraceae bacterium]
FATAAVTAQQIGCHGIEIHGAHGYLIDQFFWAETNHRNDQYGGSIANRSRFAAEIVREIRHRVGEQFPIFFRYSLWKQQNYGARLVQSPQELEQMLAPLVDAGVDLFDCSTRRFWEPEFGDSKLNVAGWTKKITGKPTMTVGSLGLEKDLDPGQQWQELKAAANGQMVASAEDERRDVEPPKLDLMLEMLNRGDIDLVGVGRMLISTPNWAELVRERRFKEIVPFSASALMTLE